MSLRLEAIERSLGVSQKNRIKQWRQNYLMDTKQFRSVLYGGQKYLKIIDETFTLFKNNPDIFKHENLEDSDRKEQRLNAVKMLSMLHQKSPVSPDVYMSNDIHQMSLVGHATFIYDCGFSVKALISYFLYGKTVYFFASENAIQQQIVKSAMGLKHIGCFGLTQFGHGSDVKGILTQAKYNHSQKCFYIHSPNQYAMKYWIGALAEVATMAVIWAQLVIDGVKYGVQPFVVPLRDPETHQVYQGIKIGDCGHKNGCNNIDNGSVLFDNYKIKKQYCLNKYSGIDQNGKYFSVFKNQEKLFGFYMGPLSVGRAFVNSNTIGTGFNALAIAIRYACIRKQFGSSSQGEQLLIDYPLVKHRLMPLLAQGLVYSFGGLKLLRDYDQNIKQLLNTSNKLMKQLHAITGPYKAMSSWFTSKLMTECRSILGGHGYSSLSGLGRLYHNNDINTTWEGDNNLLLQQTTKYILKIFAKLQRDKDFQQNSLSFLVENLTVQENPNPQLYQDLNFLENIFKIRVRDLAQSCLSFILEQKGQGMKLIDIWNQSQPYFGNNLAFAFGDLSYLINMRHVLNNFQGGLKQVVTNCVKLWVFTVLEQTKWGNREARMILQEKICNLCQWMTPRSVFLIDSFVPPSDIIGSVFANQDGQGFKQYITKLMTGKNVFQRVPWFEKILENRGK